MKTIIHQNKKGAFDEFLFGSQLNQSIHGSNLQQDFEKKIQIIQNKLNSLQDKVIDLERKIQTPKDVWRG